MGRLCEAEMPIHGAIKGAPIPIPSMHGIFTYIWLMCMVNVGKYTIHGSYGTVIAF